jgi:hypothetical protein
MIVSESGREGIAVDIAVPPSLSDPEKDVDVTEYV